MTFDLLANSHYVVAVDTERKCCKRVAKELKICQNY